MYLAAACAPDLDSLSATYSATSNGGTSGTIDNPEGGNDTGNGGSGPITPVNPCANKVKDSKESDVDCGGTSTCDRCTRNAKCTSNNDCESEFCKSGRCTDPTCTDKVKNQGETGTDCGGPCLPCDIGVACAGDADCTGEYCLDKVCADHCTSGKTESDETDTDCGGSCTIACGDNKACKEATDCKSLICSNNKCQVPTCSDQVKNQDESDKDCGGVCAATKPCAVSFHCNTEADCESWVCSKTTGKCVADSVTVAAADIIDDFEDGDLNLAALGTPPRVGNWYTYGDGTGIVTEDIATVKRGTGTKVLRGTGKDFTKWGSGVGTDLNNKGTKGTWDASAYAAITFWARVAAPAAGLAVTVALPDIDTDKLTQNHTCDDAVQGCDHHYFKTVSVTSGWQRFVIAFNDVALEPGGAQIDKMPVPAFKPGALSSVQFRINSGVTYDLYIDDVAFVKP